MAFKVPEKFRYKEPGPMYSDSFFGNNGCFVWKRNGFVFVTIASDGEGWEHVSVHLESGKKELTPTWEQMCYVKGLFWSEDDCVIQYHPTKSEYVNLHKHTLHLWRPTNTIIPIPPKWMVGF